MDMEPGLKAYVVGYTGATGKALVRELAESRQFASVSLIGRRKVEYNEPELQRFEQKVIDFEQIDANKDWFAGYDVGFCALGSTRKNAGSAEAFTRIDYGYVHDLASASKEGGLRHFHYVSSAGANAKSGSLYVQTKGRIEEALARMNFDRLSIYRPMALDVEDGREELRLGEAICFPLFKCCCCCCFTTLFTECKVLARAMINTTFTEKGKQNELIKNKEIYHLGGEKN